MFEYKKINGEDRVLYNGADLADLAVGNHPHVSSLAELIELTVPDLEGYMNPIDLVLSKLEEENQYSTEEAINDIVWDEGSGEWARLSFRYGIEYEIDAQKYLVDCLDVHSGMTELWRIYKNSVHFVYSRNYYDKEEKFFQWLNEQLDYKLGGPYGEGKPFEHATEMLSEEIHFWYACEAEYRGGGEEYHIIDDYVLVSNGTREMPLLSESHMAMIYCQHCEERWYADGAHYWHCDTRGILNLEKMTKVDVETFDSDITVNLVSIGKRLNEIKDMVDEINAMPMEIGAPHNRLHKELYAIADDIDRKFVFGTRQEMTATEVANMHGVLVDDNGNGLCPICRAGLLSA